MVDPKDYEVEGPASPSYKDFKTYAADMAEKYPDLKNSYTLLLECWNHYHGNDNNKKGSQ